MQHCLSPVLQNFPQVPWTFEDKRKLPHNICLPLAAFQLVPQTSELEKWLSDPSVHMSSGTVSLSKTLKGLVISLHLWKLKQRRHQVHPLSFVQRSLISLNNGSTLSSASFLLPVYLQRKAVLLFSRSFSSLNSRWAFAFLTPPPISAGNVSISFKAASPFFCLCEFLVHRLCSSIMPFCHACLTLCKATVPSL